MTDIGQSPTRTAMVLPPRNSTEPCTTFCSLTPVRSMTRPLGVTIALKPVGAACNTQRPVSSARSRDDAICCVWTIVNQYDEPFVGLTRICPPWRIASRARLAKKISHEMLMPMGPSGVSSTAGPVPGKTSRGGSAPPANGSTIPRSGTYSPKGTVRTL